MEEGVAAAAPVPLGVSLPRAWRWACHALYTIGRNLPFSRASGGVDIGMNRFKRLPITRQGEAKTKKPEHSGSDIANSTGRATKAAAQTDFGASALRASLAKSHAVARAGGMWCGAGSLGGYGGSLSEDEMRAWGQTFNDKVEAPPRFDAAEFGRQLKPVVEDDL